MHVFFHHLQTLTMQRRRAASQTLYVLCRLKSERACTLNGGMPCENKSHMRACVFFYGSGPPGAIDLRLYSETARGHEDLFFVAASLGLSGLGRGT